MSNIIHFPTYTIRNKQAWVKKIDELMELLKKQSDMPEELENIISKKLVEVSLESQEELQFQLSIDMPSSISTDELAQINTSIQNAVSGSLRKMGENMWVKLMICEAKICLLEFNKDNVQPFK